jgi:hypothetical protein
MADPEILLRRLATVDVAEEVRAKTSALIERAFRAGNEIGRADTSV